MRVGCRINSEGRVEPLVAAAVIAALVLAALTTAGAVWFRRSCRLVDQGKALIITKNDKMHVTLTSTMVPAGAAVDELDITMKRLDVDFTGDRAVACKDGTRAEIQAAFFVRVTPDETSIKRLVEQHGVDGAASQETFERLFATRFRDAIKGACRRRDFAAIAADREAFADRIVAGIGTDLDGYLLERLAVNQFTQAT